MVACGNMCQHMLPPPACVAGGASCMRQHMPTHVGMFLGTTHPHTCTHINTPIVNLFLLTNHPMLCLWQNTAISTARHAALYTHGCYNIALLAVFVAQHCYTATHAAHWAHSSSELISNLHHHKLRYCSRPCTMPRAPLNITTTATDMQVILAVWQV